MYCIFSKNGNGKGKEFVFRCTVKVASRSRPSPVTCLVVIEARGAGIIPNQFCSQKCIVDFVRCNFCKFLLFRAASSIGNTDFFSVTDFFAQKGGNPHIFRYFSWCFIGNFTKLHYLVKKQFLWTLNFKIIGLQPDINREQDLYMHSDR